MLSFDNNDYWRAIVLYGLNNATYKIALAKSLLDLAETNQSVISWETLSKSFLNQYVNRLSTKNSPQQANPSRLTVMERIVRDLNAGRITESEAISLVGNQGLNDVVPRFQTIGKDKTIIGSKFYTFEFGRTLTLHDALFAVSESPTEELLDELEARWSLLEGAFTISSTNWSLRNDIREIYLSNGHDRNSLTSNIPFLQGYQGNTCFYCGETIDLNDIHVDHVLPRQVVCNDEIWNLVLSHSYCNSNKSDKLVGNHYIEKLITRNENIMGSNHPWKAKIELALGNTASKRKQSLQRHYENVKSVIGLNYWGGIEGYNPQTDLFYRKLITKLNNR